MTDGDALLRAVLLAPAEARGASPMARAGAGLARIKAGLPPLPPESH